MCFAYTWKTRLPLLLLSIVVAAPAVGDVHEVQQQGLTFVPANIVVAPGDTVRWTWTSLIHTVTSGASCTFDGIYFDEPLTAADPLVEFMVPDGVTDIPYFCRPHCLVSMTGSIAVDSNAIDLVITVDGDQSVPAVDTPAAGSGTGRFYPSVSLFTWDISFSGLTGVQTAAHFHGAAPQCSNTGVQIALPLGSPIVGSATLTAQQAADMLAGLWYVNIHSDLHPAGEIRGQVMPAPLLDPIPAPIPVGDVEIELEVVATNLTAPNWGTFAPGDSSRLFVTDQDGILWAVDLATGTKSIFLDASAQLVDLGIFGPDSFDERGLLGVAFHPNYATNGLLYTYTSEPISRVAEFSTIPPGETADHQAVIGEWQVPDPTNPASVVDPNSLRDMLRVDEPQFNHNAGCVNFGPDGMLYIALGDGGGADDKDGQDFIGDSLFGHGCGGNGADNTTALGTILRIDPGGNNSANGQYGIPPDNPFVGMAGIDEIYAYGFRNPFRFSFDSQNGDMYVADVGQNHIEEIDVVTSGGNYGWKHMEGSFFFVANGNQPGYVTDMALSVPAGLTDPIAEYDHDEGIAVVGGFVYRGEKVPPLAGRYGFGDSH